jgi:hypothetical protein
MSQAIGPLRERHIENEELVRPNVIYQNIAHLFSG